MLNALRMQALNWISLCFVMRQTRVEELRAGRRVSKTEDSFFGFPLLFGVVSMHNSFIL